MPEARAAWRLTIERACTLAVCAAAALLVACGGDAPTNTGPTTPPPAATPSGSYTIATINAKALPVAVIADSGYSIEVTAGTMSLTSDGNYSAVESYRQTVPGNIATWTDTTRGTWALAGSTITFTNTLDQPPSTFQATWSSSGTLTLQELDGKNTNVFVYSLAK